MRVVLDTNILVRAQASPGGPAEAVLDAIVQNPIPTLRAWLG